LVLKKQLPMDEKSYRVVMEEVEKGVKEKNTIIDQYKQVMNCNYELKQKMKEEFYKQKIQEAKDKKVKPIVYNEKIFRFLFKWDELPAEVEKQILDYKEELDKVYISQVIKSEYLTYKSFNGFIFKYRSENDEGFKWVPNISVDFPTWLWAMVNKKNIIEELKNNNPSKNFSKTKSKAIQKEYDRITRDKTPSLEDYIEYRKEEKKKQSEDRKKKKKDDPVVYNSNHKIGDIICSDKKVVDDKGDLLEMTDDNDDDCYIYIHPYRIIGETKAQYRVERLSWDRLDMEEDDVNYNAYNYRYTIDKDTYENTQGIKSKNIGKKSILELEPTWDDNGLYYDYYKKY